jgi:hypothetical protein
MISDWRPIKAIAHLTMMLAVVACGGGGGGGGGSVTSNPPPPSDPGGGTGAIDRGGVASGPIDGFGSVIVNGVHFDTSDAVIIVDGAVATQADLAVGQVVLVVGTFDDDGLNGTAESVEYDENVEGPIENGSLDTSAGTFRVLGQTVLVTATTSFDDDIQPPSLDGLAEGDFVEVSGLPDAGGRIVATRIESDILAAGDPFEVTGTVESLDTAVMKFNINDLVVDYGGAQLDDFPGGTISDGDLVEAEGTTLSASGELIATRVELRDELEADNSGEDGDDVEVEGLITVFRSQTDFDIGSLRVLTNSATRFEGGTAADLGVNVRVEVEGQFNSDGSMLAEEVEFEAEDDLEVSATVASVDVASGTLTVLDITVRTTADTRFEDKLEDMQVFGLENIRPGDFVEIRGFSNNTDFVAARIERDDPEDSVSIQGPASDVASPGLTILGTSVLTTGSTEFEDGNDNPITAGEFFASAEGQIVKVSGTWDGSVLVAEEVEIEGD